MKTSTAWIAGAALVAALVTGLAGGDAGHAAAPRAPAAGSIACQPGPRALGTSRTVELDTTGGARFGGQQYGGTDFLADGEVVLTFDDGPLRHTTSTVVAALDRHCAKATFFMVGAMALADPGMVKDIARRGHTIGSHTWSHKFQLRKTPIARATYEIELGHSAVQKALGAPIAPFFRFPFLSDGRAALAHLASRNIGAFSIDVDATDYRAKGPDGPEIVYNTVMNELAARRKGILLFHDIQPATVAALPRILDALKARGFRVVHMVPKSSAPTLAEYDALVNNEAKRKQLQASLQLLAPRTVTWPMASPRSWQAESAPVAGPPPPVQVQPRPVQPAYVPPQPGYPAQQQPYPPPPGYQQPGVPYTPPPPPAPVRRAEPQDDWRRRIFGN